MSYNEITETIKKITSSSTNSKSKNKSEVTLLRQIQEKLFYLQKEKSGICCSSIKFTIKMMSKILQVLEGFYDDINLPKVERFRKNKIFLKITRLITIKANEECLETQGNENKLFDM